MWTREKVIEQLNDALSDELTAIVQYMTQSEMCNNWGYKQLGERTKARAIEEMKHAEGLIERIIFLDDIPSAAGCDRGGGFSAAQDKAAILTALSTTTLINASAGLR